MKIRLIAIWLSVLATLGFVNWQSYQREDLIANGAPLFLELAPVDPRSLMQGDYMDLRYGLVDWQAAETMPLRGMLVIKRDERNIGSFVRVYQAGEQLAANEILVKYRNIGYEIRIGAESYFFQEGDAPLYENAKYGGLRVSPTGDIAITGLYEENLKRLGK